MLELEHPRKPRKRRRRKQKANRKSGGRAWGDERDVCACWRLSLFGCCVGAPRNVLRLKFGGKVTVIQSAINMCFGNIAHGRGMNGGGVCFGIIAHLVRTMSCWKLRLAENIVGADNAAAAAVADVDPGVDADAAAGPA